MKYTYVVNKTTAIACMHYPIEYISHFLFYRIWTLFCICTYVVFTYIVLLSQHQCMLIWGFEQYWWCLEKTQSLPPSCRVGSLIKSIETNLKKWHCLLAYSLPLSYILCFTEITVCGHCWTVSCKVMFTFWNPNPSNILNLQTDV